MEQTLSTLKSLFKPNPTFPQSVTEPQICFKMTFSKSSKVLKVKLISAKQLPSYLTSTNIHGYLIKVTVFPEKEKYETKLVKESSPTFNEEFSFTLHSFSTYYEDYFKGKFVSFTVYAVLENTKESFRRKPPESKLKRFFSFSGFGDNFNMFKKGFNHSPETRRTIGVITYNLDIRLFTQKLSDDILSTPDIWRNIMKMASALQTKPREGRHGSVEMMLSYAVNDDSRSSLVKVSITKFRCNLQTRQQHKELGGQLYIKIIVFERENLIEQWKSNKFDPTISLKLDANTATLQATVNNLNLEQVKILVWLICKDKSGKKIMLGKIEIDSKSELWTKAVKKPSVPVTRMINFE